MRTSSTIKWLLGLGSTLLAGVLGAAPALAAVTTGIEEGGPLQQALGLGTGDIRIIIANLIRVFLGLLGVIAVVLIVYGGFLWMTSAGNEERVTKAKQVIINAIIGLVIIMMSYIIVAFVLGKLLGALGYSSTGWIEDGGGPGGIPSTTSVFTIDSVSPQGTQTIKNLTVRLTFNRQVDETTVDSSIVVTATDSGTTVDGELTVTGDRVRFHPTTLCDGYDDEYCFDSNTAYTITLGSGLKSADGLAISCGGLYDSCSYTFTSGDLVDTEAPSVVITYPDYGDSISLSALVPLQALVKDDGGVSEVEFYVDGALIDTVAPDGITPLSFEAELNWDTTALVALQRYGLTAVAYDVNDHSEESSEVRVIARALHCFSGSVDEDETGEDCGGVDCGACGGSSCTTDEDCQSGVCSEEGVCVDVPEITSVSPGSGAVLTYVTISGNNFGSSRGSVLFGDAEAEFADCEDAWGNDQVIVKVPESLTEGDAYIITLTTADDYSDTTQDDNGSLIDNFVINTTKHPGICSVTPSSGEVGAIATVYGAGFGESQSTSTLYFGSSEANAYSSWSNTQVKATVPTLTANDYSVTLWVDGLASNAVDFSVVDSDAEDVPVLSSIDPDSGPIGQYVTLSGSGFGSSADVVYFINNDDTSSSFGAATAADVDFPAVCEDDYWSRTQIIVKVPEELEEVAYVIVVRKGTATSNTADFTVTAGEASPGVCSLSPDSGPAGLEDVTIFGEGFGGSGGSVHFYDDIEATITSWSDEEVVLTVPNDAATGPVTLVDKDDNDSNDTNFEVADCNSEDICDVSAEQCCTSGACVGIDQTCPETLAIGAEYVWTFSTGDIPVTPTIQVDCSTTLISPTPWDGRSGGDAVCVNAGISATFDVNMDADSLSKMGNISLAKCDDVECVSTTAVELGETTVTDKSFTIYPVVSLDASGLYQITLSSAITSSLGVAIAPTAWTFTTSADSDDCEFAGVNVTPATDTIEELDGHATYAAQALASDECIILNNSNISWSWSLDPESGSYAAFDDSYSSTCTGEPSACQTVKGVAEGTSVITAEEDTQGLDDAAQVIVNLTNPYAVDYWPGCATGGTACINAAIGAQFNTVMDDVSVEAVGNIHLYACSDESCTTHSDDISIDVERSDADESIVNISVNDSDYTSGNLTPHAYFEVVFTSTIESQSGVPLSEYYSGDFSWTFLTRDSKEACAVGSVVMNPTSSTVDYVGATSVFDSVPYSDPDDCSTSGQRLTATGYDWAWVVEDVAIASLWSDGLVEVVEDAIPSGCTTSCLSEGTDSYEAICGEDADGDGSLLDNGEDCDDGDGISGDGCSSTCQSEGTSACSDASGKNCCGNDTLDTGEECDDGDSADNDGCSPVCLNEGASGGVTTCGDGIVTHSDLENTSGWAGGEDCDYASSDDDESVGCSQACLYEGSVSTLDIVGICGDGIVDAPAEQCDGGLGCSDHCLYEGSDECADPSTDALCCGNGSVETQAYESCDDGNGVNGDGCSTVCLLEGSSSLYSSPSWCGDGVSGIGEAQQATGYDSACEVSSSDLDGLVEPEQVTIIATGAPSEVADGVASTVVSAQTENEKGEALLNLSCSCESDNDCSSASSVLELGCGTGGCCYKRPEVTDYTPSAGDACRNTLISFDFDTAMALATFTDNVTVELSLEDDETCPYTSVDTTGAMLAPGGVVQRAWLAVQRLFSGLISVGQAAKGSCELPITFTSTPLSGGGDRVSIIYTQLLEADHDYDVVILGDPGEDGIGVRSTTGVGLKDDYTYDVAIGGNACSFDSVSIEDTDEVSPGLFTTVAEEHDFTATALTIDGGVSEAIVPIPGTYDWDWSQTWWSTDDTVLSVPETGTDTVTESTNTVTAAGETGTASIYASAIITSDTLFDPSTKDDAVYGSSESTANLCENPWPDVMPVSGWSAFEDSSTANDDPDADGVAEVAKQVAWMHFSTYFCRDAGDAGLTGDYPDADVVAVNDPPSDVMKEYLFKLDGGDAIGIRVAANDDMLSIEDWYAEQEFTGSPSSTTVDGYQALLDGRTTYVSAANLSGETSGTIYPNVYVISYNEDASEETKAVFDQMLDNWEFNTNLTNDELCYESNEEPSVDGEGNTISCSSNLDCSSGDCRADKGKLRRDMQRLTDLRQMTADLEDYGAENGRCSATTSTSCTSDDDCDGSETCEPLYPTVPSGSFLRAMSSSAWDSWQSVLGAELGVTLPTDPTNAYAECGDAGGSYTDYNSDTCWYEAAAQYVCPTGSHAYHYKNIGGNAYDLWADLEFDYESGVTEWGGEVDGSASDDLSIVAGLAFTGPRDGFQEDATCTGAVMGTSAACGDGVIGSSEKCETGDTSAIDCTVETCVSSDPDYDGVSCDDIDCDDITLCSSTNTATAGTQLVTCNDSCAAYNTTSDAACVPYRCGNGVIDSDSGEKCDDGSHNGEYGYCGTSCAYDDTAFYCGDATLAGGEICDNGEDNGTYAVLAADSCSATCDGTGAYCGDEEITNAEVCDGSETWAGALCYGGADAFDPCESDSDCDSGVCGGGYSCSLDSEVSCSGTDDTSSCGSWGDCVLAEEGEGFTSYACELDEGSISLGVACTDTSDTSTCGDMGTCVEQASDDYTCAILSPDAFSPPTACTGVSDTTTCAGVDGAYCGEYASGQYVCLLPVSMLDTACDSSSAFSFDESVCSSYTEEVDSVSTSVSSICAYFGSSTTTYACEWSAEALAGDVSCEDSDDTVTCGSTSGGAWACRPKATTDYACASPNDASDPYGETCSGTDDTSTCGGGAYCGEYASGQYACFSIMPAAACDESSAFSTDDSVCEAPGVVCARFDNSTYTCELTADISCSGTSDAVTCEAYDSALECDGASSYYSECDAGTVCEDYDDAGEAREDDTNCDSGSRTLGVCDSADDLGEQCSSDSSCDSGTCSTFEYDLTRTRSCDATCSVSGSWGLFCERADESCGNGVVDGTEVCDDGNESNNDACTTSCTENVCGDGYLYTDHESCDRGSENGETCEADYGSTCRYCSISCVYLTSSSAYCGDGVADAPEESCDGSDLAVYNYYDASSDDKGDTCTTLESTDDSGDYTCRSVGVCSGGEYNGAYCTTNTAPDGFGGSLAMMAADQSYCPKGTCILPTCSADCGSTCPFSYAEQSVEVTSEEAGATARSSINLYASESSGSPNLATLTIPACTIENGLTADLNDAEREFADVDVMFILDDSVSMSTALGDSTRLAVLSDTVTDAIDQLYDAYNGVDAEMRIGYAYMGGVHGTDSSGDSKYSESELTDFAVDIDGSYFVSDDNEADLVDSITSKLSKTRAGTPLNQVLRSAQSAFASDSSTDSVKFIILFTDGDIRNSPTELTAVESVFGLTAASNEAYAEAISPLIEEIKADGISVYSATFGSDTSCAAYEGARWSSMDCTAYDRSACYHQYVEADYECVEPSNNITYAFAAEDADGLSGMYQSIIDAILDVTVTITDADGNESTATVDVGDSIDLPLPDLFVCDDSGETGANIEVTFTGSGSIAFDNIQLNMCAP